MDNHSASTSLHNLIQDTLDGFEASATPNPSSQCLTQNNLHTDSPASSPNPDDNAVDEILNCLENLDSRLKNSDSQVNDKDSQGMESEFLSELLKVLNTSQSPDDEKNETMFNLFKSFDQVTDNMVKNLQSYQDNPDNTENLEDGMPSSLKELLGSAENSTDPMKLIENLSELLESVSLNNETKISEVALNEKKSYCTFTPEEHRWVIYTLKNVVKGTQSINEDLKNQLLLWLETHPTNSNDCATTV